MVRVDASERALYPDHPFIHAQDKFSKTFGSSSLVAIALVVEDGNIFTPETLAQDQAHHPVAGRYRGEPRAPLLRQPHRERDELRDQIEEAEEEISPRELMKRLDRVYPPYPVNHDRVQSLYHRSTRVVTIEPDGAIVSDVLIKKRRRPRRTPTRSATWCARTRPTSSAAW